MTKLNEYQSLVEKRKQCSNCTDSGLINPSSVCGGTFDSNQIGPWTRWQGSLDAQIMVIGQDWGDKRYFEDNKGGEAKSNPTNKTLIQLLAGVGINLAVPEEEKQLQVAFFTNAILCLKGNGLQGPVKRCWFQNCSVFLKKQVEIVAPKIVISLGEMAFRALLAAFELKAGGFKAAVEDSKGILLPNGSILFPVYHCGARILNTHRSINQQRQDWEKVNEKIRDILVR
jgi:DNA polymerase